MTQSSDVLLIGAGGMALAYVDVLKALEVTPKVLGRGTESAARFAEATGLTPTTGPLEEQLQDIKPAGASAIVTVNAHLLAEVTMQLIDHGVTRLLVEKPAALDVEEMETLLSHVTEAGAEVYVAYNRRFLGSVRKAEEIIAEDGGLVSLRFDFSEASHRIAALNKPERELRTWFYANSTHVIDLAFHLFGKPQALNCSIGGQKEVDWHPQAGVWTGFGHRIDGAQIAWHANWVSPGRWGVEALTRKRRIILQPIEKLRVQSHEGFAEVDVEIDDADDLSFKPGVLRQTRAFLTGEEAERLVRLEDHADHMKFYEAIRTGVPYQYHRPPPPPKKLGPKDIAPPAYEVYVRESITGAFAAAHEGRMDVAVQKFIRARSRSHMLADQNKLQIVANKELGLLKKEREHYRSLLRRDAPGDRKLVIMADSLGMPRAGEKHGTFFGAERTYSGVLRDRFPDLSIDSICQRHFTTSRARQLLEQEIDLGRDADFLLHLGLNDCASRMFLEPERYSLALLSEDTRDLILEFCQTYRADIIRHQFPHNYVLLNQFRDNLDSIVTLLRERGARKIIFTTIILPPQRFWAQTPDINRNFAAYNLEIMDAVRRHDLTLFDLDRQIWEEAGVVSLRTDGFHLTDAGHRLFVDRCAPLLS